MYCTECGAIIPDGVKFCSSCGSRISTSEETTTSEQEQIQVQISELRGVLATAQEGNDNTRSIILIGIAFFCLFLIFKPGPLGFSMFDLASYDCYIDYENDDWYENSDCVAERSAEQAQVAILGIISLACFYAVLKKPEPEEEDQEEIEEEQEEIALSPLEKNKATLKRKKLVEKWSGAVVLIICIYSISLMLSPTNTGLQEADVRDFGIIYPGDDLMMNAIEAFDVNNCLDKAYDSGGCPIVTDSAKETIRNSLTIMILANIIGYFVLKKSKEQISNIQDSITEMEEE